ncbi:MAG: Spi family protease inhibitor, partial [Candidatus Cryptobacteroides sp.]
RRFFQCLTNNQHIKTPKIRSAMSKQLLISLFWVTLILMGCSKEVGDWAAISQDQDLTVSFGISPDVQHLSDSDARTVADIFLSRRGRTKAGSTNAYNVIAIPGKTGSPAMYAVNLSDGYVIVSATKEFYPIVAEIDHGSYPEYETGTGFDLLRDELIDAIDASAGKEIPEEVRDSWRMFESVDNYIPKTKSMSDDYYDAYVELADYATANGYTMYKLGEARERELPDELIEYFEAHEDTESPFLGEYSFDNSAYILERYVEDPITYGPYVTTKWDQGTPFNLTREIHKEDIWDV